LAALFRRQSNEEGPKKTLVPIAKFNGIELELPA
jgi:hypothetical protein